MTFTWENGKQLTQSVANGTTTAYAYGTDGLRIAKAVGNNAYIYIWDGNRLISEYRATSSSDSGENLIKKFLDGVLNVVFGNSTTLEYLYDESDNPYGFIYGKKSLLSTTYTTYYYVTNLQGDIVAIVDKDGNEVASYTYNAYGEIISQSGAMADINPLRYRGYYYDTETGLYYLQSRYYDASTARFINADDYASTGQDFTGTNMFAYCGNNPISRTDTEGSAWWHWALGAAIVVTCAAVVVATAGGALGGILAVAAVSNGFAAATTASTIAAAAFIGSATMYTVSALTAWSMSSSVSEFNNYGSWWVVVSAAAGAVIGGGSAYLATRPSASSQPAQKQGGHSSIDNDIIGLERTRSALKTDPNHAFPNIVDNYAGYATKTQISNGTLYQLPGSYNGVSGRFEWIAQNNEVTHRMFVPGGGINGIPIKP